jgi:hypothetical protein
MWTPFLKVVYAVAAVILTIEILSWTHVIHL